LALGKSGGMPVLFVAKEKEPDKELDRERFEMPILFLEDYDPQKE